jgi:hypothetical protein
MNNYSQYFDLQHILSLELSCKRPSIGMTTFRANNDGDASDFARFYPVPEWRRCGGPLRRVRRVARYRGTGNLESATNFICQ